MAVSNAVLLAKIDALEKRVTALAAKVKADETANASKFTSLNPLISAGASQGTFLANLGKLGFRGQLTDDPFGGSTWGSNERDYVNSSIDRINSIETEMINQGWMFPS